MCARRNCTNANAAGIKGIKPPTTTAVRGHGADTTVALNVLPGPSIQSLEDKRSGFVKNLKKLLDICVFGCILNMDQPRITGSQTMQTTMRRRGKGPTTGVKYHTVVNKGPERGTKEDQEDARRITREIAAVCACNYGPAAEEAICPSRIPSMSESARLDATDDSDGKSENAVWAEMEAMFGD